MSYVTLPAVGSQIYVLPLGAGYLPASALALSDGSTIGSGNPLPITGTITISSSTSVKTVLVDPTGGYLSSSNPLYVAATALPLPTGAATESGNLATIATATGRIPAQGQALAAASMPVVLPVAQDPVAYWQSGGASLVAFASAPTVVLGTGSAAIGSVTVTSAPTTAITAASLPLPAGAATSAKQPALGTAGTPSADVLSVQGISGGTAIKVDGSATTQPVSGSVSLTGTLPAFASTPTVTLGTGSAAIGSVIVTSAPTTAITAASLPLPTGAATSALQGAGLPASLGAGGGVKIDGSGTALPVSGTITALAATLVSAGNSSTTTLAGNATFTGSSQDCSGYSQVSVLVFADVASATNGLSVQVSSNGTNWDDVQTRTVAAGTATHMAIGVSARYVRVVYTNGASAQSAFRLSTTLLSTPFSGTTTDVDTAPVTGDQALLTQAVMVGKTTAGGGAYVAAKVNPSGALSADVSGSTVQLTAGTAAIGSVTVTSAPTTAITAASLPLPTGAATSALQGGGLPAALGAGGGLKVDGSGTALPVSGTVTANIGTSGSLALDATLTGGTSKAIARGGAKGTTTAADVTSTSAGTNHNALDVALYDASGNLLGSTTNRLITQPHDGTNPLLPTGAAAADASSNATVISQIGARLASYNGSTWDRVRSAVTSIGSTYTGMVNMLPVGVYNSSRTTRTTGQGGPLETDSTGALLVNAIDTNGNMSGAIGAWDFANNAGSALPAAGYVLKASAGAIAGFVVLNGTGGSAFLQVHNLASATGYSASTLLWVAAASTGSASASASTFVAGGLRCTTGIVLVWSTTQFTYTSVASNTGSVIAWYR